jgi:ribosomal protein L27
MLRYKNHQRVFIKPATQSGRLNKLDKSNKRAQIGETITWFIATVIIIGVLLIFIWISFLISKAKAVSAGDISYLISGTKTISGVSTDLGKESAVLAGKTMLAENITNNEDKQAIEDILKKQNGG